LLALARERSGRALTGFELMARIAFQMVVDHLPGARDPLAAPYPWYVILEVSSGLSEEDARDVAERTLAEALAAGTVSDAAIAVSLEQARAFWRLRHGITEAQKHEGGSIKHDVSVAVERVPEFIERAVAATTKALPGIRPVPFGHMGDGNIHFNLSQPPGMGKDAFMARAPEMHAIVHGIVAELGGSISAEHGIGRYKRELLKSVKSEIELDLMRRIKRAFDPNNILNPGRVI